MAVRWWLSEQLQGNQGEGTATAQLDNQLSLDSKGSGGASRGRDTETQEDINEALVTTKRKRTGSPHESFVMLKFEFASLPVSVWVVSGNSGFLQESKDMKMDTLNLFVAICWPCRSVTFP
ncbi:unnamed protein product [Pleuronectes platessa]|uniref:Uncharacterized protein n=1 Tax=Pleuronectes platessa TaxID=8262 RepID=A0A9N7TZ05_PLEPL|nr:unnamed protein product [Pleuronectes platessa]